MIEIVEEADPNCPLCEMAKRYLRALANKYNVAFTVRYYATKSVAAAWGSEPVTQHLYSPETASKYRELKPEVREVLAAMTQLGLNLYPVIRFRYGVFKNKEIVVRGWSETEEFKAKLENILTLLKTIDG
jgi:predicted DsbA family dithiol-disulfide isomerase